MAIFSTFFFPPQKETIAKEMNSVLHQNITTENSLKNIYIYLKNWCSPVQTLYALNTLHSLQNVHSTWISSHLNELPFSVSGAMP